jgi:hypothetical protein
MVRRRGCFRGGVPDKLVSRALASVVVLVGTLALVLTAIPTLLK